MRHTNEHRTGCHIPGVFTLNVTISEENTEEDVLKILPVLRPTWASEDVVFKTYTGGVTNTLISCTHKDDLDHDDTILFRIYGENTEIIVDRDMEMISMYIFNQAGCCKPLYARFNNGLVYGFIAGSCLDTGSVREEYIGSLIAKEMVRLTSIDPSVYRGSLPDSALDKLANKNPILFVKLRKFLEEVPTVFIDPDEREEQMVCSRQEIEAEVDMLEKELVELESPVIFCHSDVHMKNIVHSRKDERCYLIDYEYVAFNYQAYDIANHFCEWAGVDGMDFSLYPDKASQMVWLRHYLEAYKSQQGHVDITPTQLEVERLYVQVNKFSLASHLFWGVWALTQERYSTVDFGHLEYAKIRFKEYFKRKDELLSLKLPD